MMKKNTANTQAQAPKTEAQNTQTQAQAQPKQDKGKGKQDKKTPDKKNEKKTPGADEKGFRASIDKDGIGHFAIPSIKAETVDHQKTYTYSAHAKVSELCRNSIKDNKKLPETVQLAIVRRQLDAVAKTQAKLTKKLEDEKLLPIEKQRLEAEQASLTAARADMVKRFPGCVSFSYESNRHATLCAAGVLEQSLPLTLDSFNAAMVAAAAVCRAALETKAEGVGTAKFTPEEREKLSAVKDEAVALFAPYCAASDMNKQFALRVKDSDIFTWYECHKVIRGERKKYAEELADMSKTLTLWFLGKIYKEAAQETQTPAPKQEAQPKQEAPKQNKK